MAASTAASMSSATRTVMTSERRTGSLVWTVPSTSTRDMRRVVVTYTLMPRLVASSPVMVEAMTWRLSRRQTSRSGAPQVSMWWVARTSPNRSTVVRPLLRVQALHRLLPAAKYRSGIGRRQARHSRPAAAQRSQ